MKKLVLAACIAVSLVSCVESSKEYKQLKQANDSLIQANVQTKTDFDEMLATLNDVEDGFNQIKESENYLMVQSSATGEMNSSTRVRLKSDIKLIAETLKNNKEQLTKLEKQLSGSRYQSAEMKKTIARLTAEVENKTKMIYNLQEELAKRDIQIQELGESIASLSGQVGNLTDETSKQKTELKAQDKELNTVWYVCGTKSELKDHKIVSGGTMFKSLKVMDEDFDKTYFTKEDMRKLKKIDLYAKKAKVLSNQPEGSYSFVKDDNGNLSLVINDAKVFWSLSKYLVIQVN